MGVIKLQGDNERRAGIHYEVDTDAAPLGVGGMGQVMKGWRVDENTNTREPVAIKFLFDDLSEGVIERARREASIQISSENLVRMYGFIEVEQPNGVKRYHVVSELLEGVMLGDLLKGRTTDAQGNIVPYAQTLYQRMTTDREGFAAEIVKSVLSGLMAMHDKHFIHRDIDPSNIMVTVKGNVKLIDYGIAKQLQTITTQDRQLTSIGQFMGKAAYAAPELVTGDVQHQNETTDIYAVGIMLYQLLTGSLPFEGADHEVLEMQLKNKLPLSQIKNKELRKVVEKATAKKQNDRYISAAEFRVDLERNERHMKTTTGKTIKIPAIDGGGRKKRFIGVAVAAVAAVAVVLGIVFADKGDNLGSGNDPQELADTSLPANGIIDSSEEKTVSRDGKTYRSAALITRTAREALAAGKTQEAVAELKKVVDAGYKSSAPAALTLRALYNHDLDIATDETYSAVPQDDKKAYEMLSLALRFNPDSAEALYYMGEAYFGGEAITGGLVTRDLPKAIDYYTKAIEKAKAENNNAILVKAEHQKQTVTSYMQ